MAALPKLDMNTVKDKDEKEKKTLKESMRQLSRKASASLKRGLTPRGSRHERKDSFDSLEEAAREEDTLAGALGPQDSAASTSESESHFTSAPQPPPAAADATPPAVTEPSQAPPLVDAPRREHELLPQFEPAETAFAAAKGDPAPHVEAPPADRPDLPQFEDASSDPAVKAAQASAQDQVPVAAAAAMPQEDAEGEAAAMVQDPPSPAHSGRPKWQEIGLALSIFALGIVASEPAMEAWRRRRQPQAPPVVHVENAKRRGGWGFS